MKLAIVILAACSAERAPVSPPASAPVVERAPGPSLYELSLTTTGSDGRVALDIHRGHPTLISMFYGSCAAACPALIGAIGRILDQMHRDDVRVLLVSFDPARDTPARLRELAVQHHLDARWTLATASADDARTLAAVLGIRYRVVGNEFFHTSAIVELDREGHMIARMEGLGDPAALIAALDP